MAVRATSVQIGRLPYLCFLLLTHVRGVRGIRLEDCRIYTSFYWSWSASSSARIGRLPYLYFLLLVGSWVSRNRDWNTAVFILPSISCCPSSLIPWIGRLPYFILSSTQIMDTLLTDTIGRLPYYYFLLLAGCWLYRWNGLEDCRIITSFYSRTGGFSNIRNWKTAVFILPFTQPLLNLDFGLEDCRI